MTVDFVQHTEGFYFQEHDPALSIARQLPYAVEIRDIAARHHHPEVRNSAQRLSLALNRISAEIKHNFLTGDDDDRVFQAFEAAHSPR